jgi:hypothetical protein
MLLLRSRSSRLHAVVGFHSGLSRLDPVVSPVRLDLKFLPHLVRHVQVIRLCELPQKIQHLEGLELPYLKQTSVPSKVASISRQSDTAPAVSARLSNRSA